MRGWVEVARGMKEGQAFGGGVVGRSPKFPAFPGDQKACSLSLAQQQPLWGSP